MATILSQLRKLRKQIHIPYRIEFVNRVIEEHEFREKIIYVHLWVEENKDELAIERT